ncbi:MAG: methyltransferase domain-containing protein [Anaerolineaceae bacterium]
MNIIRMAQVLIARLIFWGHHRCNVCGHRVGQFLPYREGWRSVPAFVRVLDFVGSDLDHHECPWCGAHDRERHLLMYMRAAGLFNALRGMAVLHFAPERRLSRLIAVTEPARYIKCDLYPSTPDVERVDMLAIPCPDATFDLVIANHVLEHVIDYVRALEEVRRVLKPGGYAILQTPFSAKLHSTWSDDGIDNDQTRLQAYGQEDHVRLFGRDIFDLFTSVGLVSHVRQHAEILSKYDSEEYGVNIDEPFFLFERVTDDVAERAPSEYAESMD